MTFYQTGDILYIETTTPDYTKQISGNLIHQGNDHRHTIEGNFALLENQDKQMFVVANDVCVLKHPEHKDVLLPKGTYLKRIVVEYDHFLEESKEVID